MTELLAVRDLVVGWDRVGDGDGGVHAAVDGVSFTVAAGESVAIVGESGSGKSTVALSIVGLLDSTARLGASSRITFEGRDVTRLDEASWRAIRGVRIGMVFQEPASALNPSMRVVDQVAEVALVHGEASPARALQLALSMLERVHLDDLARTARAYPHELSGGMRQRVMIAMALLLSPALLIADEPTSALDVTTQAQILALLRELRADRSMAMLLVTHDLGVVSEMCERTIVMRRGRMVEDRPTAELFAAPSHEYTRELLDAVPRLEVRP